LPAVLVSLNERPLLLVILALPAELAWRNERVPLSKIVEPPAVLLLLKKTDPPGLAVMVAFPAVLALRKLTKPPLPLVMVAFPAVLVSLKAVNPVLVFVMVAVPAVLELKKVVFAEKRPVLVMAAFPAVLPLGNDNREMVFRRKLGALEEALLMPAPVNIRVLDAAKPNE